MDGIALLILKRVEIIIKYKYTKMRKLYNTIKQSGLFHSISNRTYWVFRRYREIESYNSSDGSVIQESFALHFVEPFHSKGKAIEAIKNAKDMQPWQEFIILHGC